ncbi:hypothetical protein ACFL6F_01740 [Planctomycetota bacterium]
MKFTCPHCEKVLNVKDEYAGRKAKCPGCGESVVIKAPGDTEQKVDSPADEQSEPKDGLTAEIENEVVELYNYYKNEKKRSWQKTHMKGFLKLVLFPVWVVKLLSHGQRVQDLQKYMKESHEKLKEKYGSENHRLISTSIAKKMHVLLDDVDEKEFEEAVQKTGGYAINDKFICPVCFKKVAVNKAAKIEKCIYCSSKLLVPSRTNCPNCGNQRTEFISEAKKRSQGGDALVIGGALAGGFLGAVAGSIISGGATGGYNYFECKKCRAVWRIYLPLDWRSGRRRKKRKAEGKET